MPELPEVEIVRRQLERACLGKKIHNAVILSEAERFQIPVQKIIGLSIGKVQRHGKRIFLDMGKRYLMIHLGMSGSIRTCVNYEEDKHDHLGLRLTGGLRIIYNDPRRFGQLAVVPRARLLELSRTQDESIGLPYYGMGPDALNWHLSRAADPIKVRFWRDLLRNVDTPIKQVLLDQAYVAGVGNIYCDEILYRCRIHPLRLASSLLPKEISKLATLLPKLLIHAIASKGSTIRGANKYRDTEGAIGRVIHQVYHKGGKPCMVCKNTIKVIKVAGRSTHFCENCQPLYGEK